MAIYRHGSLAGAISGSVGGITFVNARGSKVVRFRPIKSPKNQRSLPSIGTEARGAFSTAVAGWQALADEPRQAWKTLATEVTFPNRLGQKRSITGYQLYLKVNIQRALRLLAVLTGAPGTVRPQQISTLDVVADVVTGLDVEIDSVLLPTLRTILTYGSLRLDGRTNVFFRDFLYLGHFSFSKGVPLDLQPQWAQRFGDLRAGTSLAIRCIPWNANTYPGTPVQTIAPVTA